MMQRTRRFPTAGRTMAPAATILALILCVQAAWAADWRGSEAEVDGEFTVQNPAKAMDPAMTVELDEVFRLGGWDGGEDEFFGVITDIVEDEEGNLYVLDSQLNEVKIYDAEGNYLNTIGREGEGPGEFRNASNLFWLPNGDLGVIQAFPSKVITLTRDGVPGEPFEIQRAEGEESGFFIMASAERVGDQLAILYSLRFFDQATGKFTATTRLSLFDGEGNETARLHEHVGGMDFANPIVSEQQFDNFGNRWTVASGGRVVAAGELEEYKLRVWGSDGELDRTIVREYAQHKRTQDEMDDLMEIYKGFTKNQPLPPTTQFVVNERHPAIDNGGLHARPDGSLWVLTSRGSDEEDDTQLGTFDVYDPKGRFVRQATLKGQCDNNQDRVMFVGDRVFVVTQFLGALMNLQGGGTSDDESIEEEPEPMAIICYRSSELDAVANIPQSAMTDSR